MLTAVNKSNIELIIKNHFADLNYKNLLKKELEDSKLFRYLPKYTIIEFNI